MLSAFSVPVSSSASCPIDSVSASGKSTFSTTPSAASATAWFAPIPPTLAMPEHDTSVMPTANTKPIMTHAIAHLTLLSLTISLTFICITFLHEAEYRFDKPTHEATNQLHRYLPNPARTLYRFRPALSHARSRTRKPSPYPRPECPAILPRL